MINIFLDFFVPLVGSFVGALSAIRYNRRELQIDIHQDFLDMIEAIEHHIKKHDQEVSDRLLAKVVTFCEDHSRVAREAKISDVQTGP